MLRVKMVYVTRVRVRKEVRCYILISLRKCTPPRAMFHIHYSSLNRCITFGTSMVTLSIVVSSFFPRKTQGGCGVNENISLSHGKHGVVYGEFGGDWYGN